MATSTRRESRIIRHTRVRKNVAGSPERPRLAIFRSAQHIYAQLIDDTKHETIVSASTTEKDLRDKLKSGGNRKAAETIGELIAKRAVEKGHNKVVFDRGGFHYQGRVAALADAARKAGLDF